jgi:hypothetical protein
VPHRLATLATFQLRILQLPEFKIKVLRNLYGPKVKGKVSCAFFSTEHHANEAYWGSGWNSSFKGSRDETRRNVAIIVSDFKQRFFIP